MEVEKELRNIQKLMIIIGGCLNLFFAIFFGYLFFLQPDIFSGIAMFGFLTLAGLFIFKKKQEDME